jgi:hypothetical protein
MMKFAGFVLLMMLAGCVGPPGPKGDLGDPGPKGDPGDPRPEPFDSKRDTLARPGLPLREEKCRYWKMRFYAVAVVDGGIPEITLSSSNEGEPFAVIPDWRVSSTRDNRSPLVVTRRCTDE